MPTKNASRSAVRTGQQLAMETIKRREAARRTRNRALKGVKSVTKLQSRASGAAALAGPALSATAGVLVAEGDSWFDYPMNDVLSLLEDEHGYDVESVAHKGDTVEEMAFSGGQLDDFARCLEKVLRRGIEPKAILLSSVS